MWWPISHRVGVLSQGGLDTEAPTGRTLCEDKAEICVKHPRLAMGGRQTPRCWARPGVDSLQEPLEGTGSASTLVLDFWPAAWETIQFWDLNHSVWGTLFQQPQQPIPLTQSP